MSTWIKWCVKGTDDPNFENLSDEYRELIKDSDQTYIFNLRKGLIVGDLELQQLSILRNALLRGRDEFVISVLKGEPFYLDHEFDNLQADLNRMLAEQKAKLVKLKIKEAEYTKYVEKFADEPPPTEADWYSQLRVLSKWAGFIIQAKQITVMDYIVYLNDFKADTKRNEKK